MKRLTLVIISILLAIQSQGQKNDEYYERLYYTCKVWGFVKYFHSETANCSINLDSILLQKLPLIESASSNDAFNQVLNDLINSPGEPGLPTIPPPFIPDSLAFNLNLEWLNDDIFSPQVRDALDTIIIRFRPRQHCLLGEAFAGGNPTFDDDILYNNSSVTYPAEELRILSLFRYWNIINYFFPYKNIMDQNWDSTLVEVLPLFVEAQTAIDYTKAVMVISKRINDSHAFIFGGASNAIIGSFYPRFNIRYIENETVVTKVHSSVTAIKPGDVILSIDGVEIETLRDSISCYTKGSNDLAVLSYVHDDILVGPYGNFNMTIENENGTSTHTLQRNWYSYDFNNFIQNTFPVWYDTVVNQNCRFGYVDMGRLTTAQVAPMMSDLWDTDAIIFDIRNYPQGTLWTLVNYLFKRPVHIASFTHPDINYPGTLSWLDAYIGSYQNEAYQGKLIILFDIRTISQAEYTCMGLEQHPESIKIGSQTKAADGNVSLVYLPGSITAYFTGMGTFYPDYSPTQRIGIIPDIEIRPSIEGIRLGKDEVLEYALNCNLIGIEIPESLEMGVSLQPNPFVQYTRVNYQNQDDSKVTITIHDISGKLISVIANQIRLSGNYSFNFDGTGLKAGTYFMRFASEQTVKVVKLMKIN